MYCFQCAREYVEEVDECAECGVGLVEEKPTPPEDVGDQDEDQVAYELYDWSFEARRMLDGLLTGEGISHGWQGAVLITREADEDRVDGLVEQAAAADGPILDPEIDKVSYDMEDWPADAQSALIDALGLAGIPHQFDADGDLEVAEEQEEEVDGIIDKVTERLAIESELGEAETVMEGLQLNDFLGDVLALANKLRKNAGDAKSTISMVGKAEELADIKTPFGFDSQSWANIRLSASRMSDALSDEDRDEETVTEAADTLSEQLRSVV